MDVQSVSNQLICEEYGELPFSEREMMGTLRAISSRQHWQLQEREARPYCSFRVVTLGRSAAPETLLLRENALAFVHPEDTFPLMDGRRYRSGGEVWENLSASGQFILLNPDWLSADLTRVEKERLLTSADAWEAYNVKYWKPRTRGDVIFNGWD